MKIPVGIVTLILLLVLTLTLGAETGGVKKIGSKASVESSDSTEFRYGINYISAYYHYESRYLSDAILERDFKFFKQHNLTYITLVAVWKYLEPSMGNYNYPALDDLKRVCEFAANYSLQVIIDFHTEMFANSPKIPDWVSPKGFQTVFTNDTVHQAWLSFLNHTASYLNDVESIYSWHMMNEPAIGPWTGNANITVNDFIQLWTEMRGIFKSWSDRLVSIRFSAYEFGTYFRNSESDICSLFDYVALNWYEDGYYTKEQLSRLISDIQGYKPVMISEFGYNKTTGNPTIDEEYQAGNFAEYINLFRNASVHDALAWMWRADNDNTSNPEGPIEDEDLRWINGTYDLAKNWDGSPRSAFYLLGDDVPPIVTIQSPENKTCYATSAVSLNFTMSEKTSWIGYSLDGQSNVTIVENITIPPLPDAYHTLIVYAKDIAGNVGNSNITSFLVDTNPPNITNVTQNPPKTAVSPENNVRIDTTIHDENGVKSANLLYTADDETWTTIEMTAEGKEMWNATIPAFPYGTDVTYRIEAQDIAGNPKTSEEDGYTLGYMVIPELPTILPLPLLMFATLPYILLIKSHRVRQEDQLRVMQQTSKNMRKTKYRGIQFANNGK